MTNSILTKRAKENQGVVFTADEHARSIVKEALFYRLHQDFPNLKQDNFNQLILGDKSKIIIDRLLSYHYQDTAVGNGIFISKLQLELQKLAELNNITIHKTWWEKHITGWDIDKSKISNIDSSANLISEDYLLNSIKNTADIIMANPPYIRQELIDKKYKQKVKELMQSNWPDLPISARSDMYIYFVLKATANLKPNGILTFIIPNSWMDNVYGEVLRELFKQKLQLLSIRESEQRHFDEEVNTVIITACKTERKKKNRIQIISETKTHIINHNDLEQLQLGWYGSLFRCPNWLLNEIETNNNINPLEDYFNVSTGIITGNNQKYYRNYKTNDDYTSAIKSPKEISSIVFDKTMVRSFVKIKDVPYTIRRASLLWVDLRGGRHIVALNQNNLPFEHTFYGLTPKNGTVEDWVILLNSTWIWLMVELFGRKSLGGGAIRLVKKDLLKLPIPDGIEIDLSKIDRRFINRPITSWRSELEQNDRKFVDEIVFKSLQIWHCYEDCIELINTLMTNRYEKARSKPNG